MKSEKVKIAAMDVENRLQNRLCVLVFILVAALVHTETLKRVYM